MVAMSPTRTSSADTGNETISKARTANKTQPWQIIAGHGLRIGFAGYMIKKD
jgi:hypothetical protein